MTHVVTDHCERCRYTECVDICPVDCFHADAERLYIDPHVCIDCGACIPACPVRAIVDEIDLEPGQQHWVEVNASRCQTLPLILEKEAPLPTAEARKAELGL
ncbi:MAG: 4Fe-4S binding protein [Burkholderiales bacterium]